MTVAARDIGYRRSDTGLLGETYRERGDSVERSGDRVDLLIVGESNPSLAERILGDVTDSVIDESSDPILIVRDR